MTHPTLAQLDAAIERLEIKREKQNDAARYFLAFACGVMNIGEPDSRQPRCDEARRKIRVLRCELLRVCEDHFPHLLKPVDREPTT